MLKTHAFVICLLVGAAGAATPVLAEPAKAPASGAPAKAEGVNLTPKFKTGEAFTLEQRTVRKDLTTIPNMGGEGKPQSMETSVDQTATYEVKVEGANAEGATLRLELAKVVVSAKLPQGSFTWDSTSPPDDKDLSNPVIVAFKPVVGAITMIGLGPDGSIKTITPDARLQPPSPGALQPAVTSLVGVDQMRMRWSTILSIKDSEGPAAVGSTWKNTRFLNSPPLGKFEFTTNNTLKSVEGPIAKVEFTGGIKLGDLTESQKAQGSVQKGELSGSVEWDTETGMARTHRWVQNAVLEANASGIKIIRSTDLDVTTRRVK